MIVILFLCLDCGYKPNLHTWFLVYKFACEEFIKNIVVNDLHDPGQQQVRYFEDRDDRGSEA